MLKVIAMAEVWMFGLFAVFGCFAVNAILVCAVIIVDFIHSLIHSANDGVEECKEKHDELHG